MGTYVNSPTGSRLCSNSHRTRGYDRWKSLVKSSGRDFAIASDDGTHSSTLLEGIRLFDSTVSPSFIVVLIWFGGRCRYFIVF